MKKFILTISLLLASATQGFAASIDRQDVNANLDYILDIATLYAGVGNPVAKNAPVNITASMMDVDTSNPALYVMSLPPAIVEIRTNIKNEPIYVNAEFVEFRHNDTGILIGSEYLNFFPAQEVISNPFNGMKTDEFVPEVSLVKGMPTGDYTGTVRFTLGRM